MITRTEIIYACSRLREDNTGDIPEEWIDYMEKAALEKIESPDLPTEQELKDEAEQMFKMYEGYTSAERWVTIGLRKGYIEGRKKNVSRIKELEEHLKNIYEMYGDEWTNYAQEWTEKVLRIKPHNLNQ